jgi:hypothetical protein
MGDLMKVIKEATGSFEQTFKEKVDNLFKEATDTSIPDNFMDKFKALAEEAYDHLHTYYEKVKDQLSFNKFFELCMLDLQYNFIGVGIVKEGEGLEFEIK